MASRRAFASLTFRTAFLCIFSSSAIAIFVDGKGSPNLAAKEGSSATVNDLIHESASFSGSSAFSGPTHIATAAIRSSKMTIGTSPTTTMIAQSRTSMKRPPTETVSTPGAIQTLMKKIPSVESPSETDEVHRTSAPAMPASSISISGAAAEHMATARTSTADMVSDFSTESKIAAPTTSPVTIPTTTRLATSTGSTDSAVTTSGEDDRRNRRQQGFVSSDGSVVATAVWDGKGPVVVLASSSNAADIEEEAPETPENTWEAEHTSEAPAGVDEVASPSEAPNGIDEAASTSEAPTDVEEGEFTSEASTGVDEAVSTPEVPTGVDEAVSTPEVPTGVDEGESTSEAPTGVNEVVSTSEALAGVDEAASSSETQGGVGGGESTSETQAGVEEGESTSEAPADVDESESTSETQADVDEGESTSEAPADVDESESTSETQADVDEGESTLEAPTGVEEALSTLEAPTGVDEGQITSETQAGFDEGQITSEAPAGVDESESTSETQTGVDEGESTSDVLRGVEEASSTSETQVGVASNSEASLVDGELVLIPKSPGRPPLDPTPSTVLNSEGEVSDVRDGFSSSGPESEELSAQPNGSNSSPDNDVEPFPRTDSSSIAEANPAHEAIKKQPDAFNALGIEPSPDDNVDEAISPLGEAAPTQDAMEAEIVDAAETTMSPDNSEGLGFITDSLSSFIDDSIVPSDEPRPFIGPIPVESEGTIEFLVPSDDGSPVSSDGALFESFFDSFNFALGSHGDRELPDASSEVEISASPDILETSEYPEPSEEFEVRPSVSYENLMVELLVDHPMSFSADALAEDIREVSNEFIAPEGWNIDSMTSLSKSKFSKLTSRQMAVREQETDTKRQTFEMALSASCPSDIGCDEAMDSYRHFVRDESMDRALAAHDYGHVYVYVKGDKIVDRVGAVNSAAGAGMGAGVIAGIAVGAIALVSLLVLGVVFISRRNGGREGNYDAERGIDNDDIQSDAYKLPEDQGSFLISNFGGSFRNTSGMIPWMNDSPGRGSGQEQNSHSFISIDTAATEEIQNNTMSEYRFDETTSSSSGSDMGDLDVDELSSHTQGTGSGTGMSSGHQ